MSKAWKIDSDKTNEPERSEAGTWGNESGVTVVRGGKTRFVNHAGEVDCPTPDKDFTVRFRITDDDNEIYYEGRMTHALADSPDILRPLDDFATPNVGATNLEIWSNIENKYVGV